MFFQLLIALGAPHIQTSNTFIRDIGFWDDSETKISTEGARFSDVGFVLRLFLGSPLPPPAKP